MRILTLALLLFASSLHCLSESLPDSTLRQMLTRAVYSWQEGRAKDAFFTLDSVIAQPISNENAGSKVKAALWTSSYLMEQRKIRPAKSFIDSALAWSQRFPMGDESVRVYQALSQWYASAGDAQGALRFKDKEWELRDSFARKEAAVTIDSLKEVIARSETQAIQKEEVDTESQSESTAQNKANDTGSLWMVIAAVILIAAIAIYFFRSRKNSGAVVSTSVPAFTPQVSTAKTPENPSGQTIPVFDFQPSLDKQSAAEESHAPATEALPLPNRETLLRLQGVELVLIRAEVLAAYQNGDLKGIRNLLNEYMAQLPFIMKTLDEAINRNETAPILLSLQHVKSYLRLFGMQGTEKLIGEVESESSTEKVSKLLSRVFQVRNHCRRAADEAKSLLEKIG